MTGIGKSCLALLTIFAVVPVGAASGGAELDPTFNASLTISGRETYWKHGVLAMALQQDGKILIGGGFTNLNGRLQYNLARLHPNGTLDETFVPVGTTNHFVESIAIQPDGKILVTARIEGPNAFAATVVRLMEDGSLDPSFKVPETSGVWEILHGRDQLIYIAGRISYVNGVARRYLARLLPDGELDLTYVPPIMGHPSTEGGMVHMTQQADHKIVLAGMFYTQSGRGYFARFNADGSEDASFNPPPFQRGEVYFCNQLQTLSEGRILHVSSTSASQEDAMLRQYDPDGRKLTTFRDVNGIPGHFSATAIQQDGKILVGGQFLDSSRNYGKHLLRVRTDGSLDGFFDVGAGFGGDPKAIYQDAWIHSLIVQPDGKILVGGQFQTYDGQPRFSLVRLAGQQVFLKKIERTDAGQFVIAWEILPDGGSWQILGSTDLASWEPIKQNVPTGSVELLADGQESGRFFKVVPHSGE